MGIFEAFNFDIIIILILIASILSGFYYSLYRQARNTLALISPFIILYFTFNILISKLNSFPFLISIRDKIFTYINKIVNINSYKNITTTFVIYLLSFIILSFLIKIIYNMFKVPVHRRVLNNPTSFSRTIGSILGLLNGYMIVMIMMFTVKPFVDINYNQPITSILNETNSKYISITKLNEYQNINVDRFNEIDYAIQNFTGRDALNQYNLITSFIEEIPSINNYIESIIPSMSEASQTLINTNLSGEDYVGTLMKEVNGSVIFKTILSNETNNDNYQTLNNYYNYLITNKGYFFVYNNYLTQDILLYDFTTFYQILIDNKDTISNEFENYVSKTRFLNTMKTFDQFNNNFANYLKVLNDSSINNLEEYVNITEELFVNNDLLIEYASTYNDVYPSFENKNNTLNIMNKVFKNYLKHDENIKLINKQMSISSKLILSENYNDWFVKDLWKKDALLNSYMKDALSSKTVQGNKLYQEYFFYRYLAYDINFDEQMDLTDLEIVLNRLDQLVSEKIVNENEAMRYFETLFVYDYSPIYDLLNQNKINENLFQEMLNLNSKYINEVVREILVKL